MVSKAFIIVAGDQGLCDDLRRELPTSRCQIQAMETIPGVLKKAPEASLIVVNAQMPEGGEDLCRRLRANPITASVTLLVRGTSHGRVPCADEVLSTNLQQTLDAIQTYLPDLAEVGSESMRIELTDEDIFDISERADAWRRLADDESWPPPPPEMRPGQDLEQFATDYAGYVRALVDAYDTPQKAAGGEQQLLSMSDLTLTSMDDVLAKVQKGINDALKGGNLQGMRTLSAGKNILFAELQRLRVLQGSRKKRPPSAGSSPSPRSNAGAEFDREASDRGAPGDKAVAASKRLGTTEPSPLSVSNKSRLTLAAEANEQERARNRQESARNQQEGARSVAISRANRSRQAKQQTEGSGQTIWWGLAALGVAAIIAWFVFGPRSNEVPVLNFVTIQQSATGIRATVSALDAERDLISYTYRWFVDDSPVAGATESTLPIGSYKAQSKVVVWVTPQDPYGKGQTMRCQPLTVVALQRQ